MNLFNILANKISYKFFGGGNSSEQNSHSFLKLRNNGEAAFGYDFIMSLDEKLYPAYLSQAYFNKTGHKLNLRNPKTLNEKIQWLKIYDNLPIKAILTDKVLVRDWVKEKIGEQYLKPVLQVCNNFDEIEFEKLPNRFIIKCAHGCKWQFMIKDKDKFLTSKPLYSYVRKQINGWMQQSFFGWSDFETQYKTIEPKIIIEELLRGLNFEESKMRKEIKNYCFNGIPHLNQVVSYFPEKYQDVFDIDLNKTDLLFEQKIYEPSEKKADETLAKTVELSKILSEGFKFVRVDWMVYNNNLYFEELTFTPHSGYIEIDNYSQIKLGNFLKLKGN